MNKRNYYQMLKISILGTYLSIHGRLGWICRLYGYSFESDDGPTRGNGSGILNEAEGATGSNGKGIPSEDVIASESSTGVGTDSTKPAFPGRIRIGFGTECHAILTRRAEGTAP